jgi:hypothetical protein
MILGAGEGGDDDQYKFSFDDDIDESMVTQRNGIFGAVLKAVEGAVDAVQGVFEGTGVRYSRVPIQEDVEMGSRSGFGSDNLPVTVTGRDVNGLPYNSSNGSCGSSGYSKALMPLSQPSLSQSTVMFPPINIAAKGPHPSKKKSSSRR